MDDFGKLFGPRVHRSCLPGGAGGWWGSSRRRSLVQFQSWERSYPAPAHLRLMAMNRDFRRDVKVKISQYIELSGTICVKEETIGIYLFANFQIYFVSAHRSILSG